MQALEPMHEKTSNKISNSATWDEEYITLNLVFAGHNEDILESYYWHLNFPYYTGKGYLSIKVEDYHYFSEVSQFGTGIRQQKGGSIRAFQENLQQMIQLIKVHMMPLLKEVKMADFYKEWFDKITINDEKIQELKSKGVSNDNEELKKARAERNEALSHMKDRWVNEVDGGRIWQMNRSATEQGLDFALLPQLFFGINLDDPLMKKKTLKEQLDEDIYPVDISFQAKEAVARFMYKFHTWLPTAIKDTEVSFKLKVSTLRQFYSQLQMYVQFMKPLLLEISRKSEGFEKNNFYRDFESENPEFANMFDNSYSFIKIMGVKGFQREGYKIGDLEFSDKGLWIGTKEIIYGECKGKEGYILSEKDGNYEFVEASKDISDDEFEKKRQNAKWVDKENLKKFGIMIFDFAQKRRNDVIQTQQGPQQVPLMSNNIVYKGHAWNLFEVATYRESLKEENLELLATFIEELNVIKDDLLYYANYFSNKKKGNDKSYNKSKDEEKSKTESSGSDWSLVTAPFEGFASLFSALIPSISFTLPKKSSSGGGDTSERDKKHELVRIQIVEDTWKLYTVHKKVKGLMQF